MISGELWCDCGRKYIWVENGFWNQKKDGWSDDGKVRICGDTCVAPFITGYTGWDNYLHSSGVVLVHLKQPKESGVYIEQRSNGPYYQCWTCGFMSDLCGHCCYDPKHWNIKYVVDESSPVRNASKFP